MADYFDTYLKAIQAKAYRDNLSRNAEVEQGMRAMNGLPQQAPMVGGFLGFGQHPDRNFQTMTAQQGESTVRALDPTTMEQHDVRQAQLANYQAQTSKIELDQKVARATTALATLDELVKIDDPEKRMAAMNNIYGPQMVAENPAMAGQIGKIDLSDEGLKKGRNDLTELRAQLIAQGAKDPTKQNVGRPRDAYVGVPQKGKNGNFWIFNAEQKQMIDTGVPWTEEYTQVDAGGGVPAMVGRHDPTRLTVPQVAPASPAPAAAPPGSPAAPPVAGQPAAAPAQPLDMSPGGIAERERALAEEKAAGTARGKGKEERLQLVIDEGRDAAKGIPTLNRVLELLDSVKTGGIEKASLNAKAWIGVQGANEAELSSSLGQAVLKDLRATFGAQFTATEGDKLTAIRAQFGASAEANRRLIQQALAIAQGAAERAMKEAAAAGDYRSAANIKETMEQSLSNPGQQSAPTAGDYEAMKAKHGL